MLPKLAEAFPNTYDEDMMLFRFEKSFLNWILWTMIILDAKSLRKSYLLFNHYWNIEQLSKSVKK
ncbi:Uncharacterized protein BM_BM14428 [Brugia malayi]|uniref:Bm14428 n=1 Tax=Brugia malayi TaxID=6279 RepID=A0A0J9Y1D8_BRUMA|nr:Uncharacterized protein BM_BM14428 [Brugia malayi]CDQ00216.2 Bm14428 [Brugia malayi]VIO90982.1 Uncharacterized protein BM_BM14428 [Brugia malayi]